MSTDGLGAPRKAAERALRYLEMIDDRPVFPTGGSDDLVGPSAARFRLRASRRSR